MPRSNRAPRPLTLRIEITRIPIPKGRQPPTLDQVGKVLLGSMARANEGYPLPRGWEITIHWRNGDGPDKSGPWSDEMTESLNSRAGSAGWHYAVTTFIERQFSGKSRRV